MELKRKYVLLLSFCIPLGVMVAGMALFQVQPFGDNSSMIIDGLHQYMPFFSILYDKLKGAESLFYTFRAGLGINFLSLFAYYLSSPFNFIILLFQKVQLNMAVSLLITIKIALSGLTAGIYFSTKTKRTDVTVVVCAVAYALNSYMVGYCWNVMWLDALMIFPVVILGLDRLIEKKDGRLYCVALFYALFCNYYIAFMICIFAVLWYVLHSFTSIKQFFLRGLAFIGYSLLAAGMSAVLLIPAYLGIRQTTSGSSMSLPGHEWLTGFLDLLTRQFDLASPISHDNFDGNANLYIGVFVIFAVVLYFLNREIRPLEKLKKAILLVFFYLSFSETILNFIWHGFHNQFGIPNRFSFLFGFVLISMLFDVLKHRDSVRNWQVFLSCVLGVGLLFVSRTFAENPLDDGIYGLAGLLILLYGVILFVMTFDKRRRKWHVTIFSFAAAAELCVTALVGFNEVGQISVSKFFSDTETMEEVSETLSDGTFYRSDMGSGKMVDENAWYNLNAVGLFGSTASDAMVTMMDSLGYYTGSNEYLYQGGDPVTNLLFGVKYVYYHSKDTPNTDFTYKESFDNIDVYENPTEGLSVGYMMDNAVEDWYYSSAYPIRVLNELAALGYGVTDVYDRIEVTDPETDGCTVERTNDGEYRFSFEEVKSDNILFTLPVEQDTDDLYIFYDGTQVDDAQIAVDGAVVKTGDLDGYMLYIGSVKAGSTVTVRFQLKGEKETGYVRLSAAALNPERFSALAEAMTSQAFAMEENNARHISGTVTAKSDQMLFFSIPYDEGWTVLVDGVKTEPTSVGDAFLAVPLEEGEHTVSLTYTPPGFSAGWKISLISLILFVGICAAFPTIRRRREALAAQEQAEKDEDEKRQEDEKRKNEEIAKDVDSGDL